MVDIAVMSERQKRIQEDIQAVVSACTRDKDAPFTKFECRENTFSFEYAGSKGRLFFSFSTSDDYPDHTVLSHSKQQSSGAFETETISDRIPVKFNAIAKDLYQDMEVALPEIASPRNSTCDEVCDYERLNSQDSHYTDCSESNYSDWDDYDAYYIGDEDEDMEDDIHMNSLLCEDMERVAQLYGSDAISHRLFGAIDDIDVELLFDMRFLDPDIAKAWKVIRQEPMVVRLHLSVSRYLDATEPKVEVFQPSQKEKFGIGSQMRKIMEAFLSQNWKKLNNDSVQAAAAKTSSIPPKKPGASSQPLSKKKLNTQLSSDSILSEVPTLVVDDGVLAKIMDMGFSAEIAKNALIITRNNFEEALNLLLSNPDSCKDVCVEGRAEAELSSKAPRPARQLPKAKVKVRGRHFLRQSSHPAGGGGASLNDLNLLPSSAHPSRNSKEIPTLENGFLVQVLQYARQRLPTLNEYCVVCDEPHVFQNGAMLKPAVCARELCVFAFQTLGVMSDATEDIATGAEVVDLLIAMANAACRSSRKEIIFDPYPTVVDPLNPTELALNPKHKNYNRVEKAMDAFIDMKDMTRMVTDLKKSMDSTDRLSYPLLQWIISSNRSHIMKLPSEKQLLFMNTPHQFLLMSSPPAKEAIFREARRKYSSTFAFHGSNIENWHSIMRHGLVNASGTKYQMHGAAYGSGIYLSPHSSVSFGYSGMGAYGRVRHGQPSGGNKAKSGASTTRFLQSKSLTCIALCEVITSKDLKKSNNIWVMPNPDHVCTRFFFVYEDGQVGDQGIDTQVDKYKKEIMRAVGYQTSLKRALEEV